MFSFDTCKQEGLFEESKKVTCFFLNFSRADFRANPFVIFLEADMKNSLMTSGSMIIIAIIHFLLWNSPMVALAGLYDNDGVGIRIITPLGWTEDETLSASTDQLERVLYDEYGNTISYFIADIWMLNSEDDKKKYPRE